MSTAIKLAATVMIVLLSGCVAVPQGQVPLQDRLAIEGKIRELVETATVAMRVGTPSALDRAQAALEVARDINPDEARVVDGLGCVEWRRGNHRLAEKFFKQALELNPDYDRAFAHLAMVAEADGDRNAARTLLQTAVKMNPLNYRSRNNYAALLLEDGQTKAAYQQLLRAVQSGGGSEAEIKANLVNVRED